MTFRQIVSVLWQRAWVIALVGVIALGAATGYLIVRDVTYTSSGVLRLNPIITEATSSGEIGGVVVDLETATVTSPDVLDAAAGDLGEPSGDALLGSISASLDDSTRNGRLSVTADGLSADASRDRVAAVMDAWIAYVDEQVDIAMTTLLERHQAAVGEAHRLQGQVNADPADVIASTNLTLALSRMSTAQAAIDELTAAAAPAAVVREPQPGTSTDPSTMTTLLIALTLGLVVGVAAVLIRDQFDNRLRGIEEVEKLTGAVGLGEIVWDPSVRRLDPPLPVAHRQRTDLSEGLRSLRTSIQVLVPRTRAVIVVTSVEPGDGKSFVSANLALAWARAGKEVVLVGGDLRRPDLGRYFGDAVDGKGLAELLHRDHFTDEDVQNGLKPSGFERLRILPSGDEIGDPADGLAGPALERVMDCLRATADVVIIDSPPAMGLADAALLTAASDGAVVIASVRRTDRGLLTDAVALLEAAGGSVLGVVVNRSRRKLPKGYSAYYLASRTGVQPATGAQRGRTVQVEGV